MDKKELIVTDNVWYKICNFFRKIFQKESNKNNKNAKENANNIIQTQNNKIDFMQNISYKDEITNLNTKKDLAEKLMDGKLSINDLTDSQVDEMTEYFTMYINDMNQKLEQIKDFIVNLKKKK